MESQTILFKKNDEFFISQEEAIQGLNLVEFHIGEPVVAIYGSSTEDSHLILAVGKKEGSGEDAYNLIFTEEGNIDQILSQVLELKELLKEHETVGGGDSNLGHVQSGGDITFKGGIGTVNSAEKVKNALTFSGYSNLSFDGSAPVTVSIPEGSTESPLPLGDTAQPGESEKWAREDHIHPAQKDILGNAESATKLQSQAEINISGAVSGSMSTDFSPESGPIEIVTTLSDHTHEISDIIGLQGELDLKAPLSDAQLLGEPTAPTPEAGDNTTKLATTAFVIREISDKLAAAMALSFKGTIGEGGTVTSLPDSHNTGDVYIAIDGAPEINGIAVKSGDMIICTKSGEVANDEDWAVIQTNIEGGAVTGPINSGDGNIVIFSGTTGKLLADSGISLSDLAKSDVQVSTGEGIEGGGSLGDGNIAIFHSLKPEEGTDVSEQSGIVTGVLIDKFGHVSGVTKTNLSGNIAAESGKYISSITLEGTTLIGTKEDLPKVLITGGEEEEGMYISGINVDPEDGYTITTTKKAESGKLKVDSEGVADFLEAKIVAGDASGKVYPVTITKEGDQLKLTVQIDVIDGGVY